MKPGAMLNIVLGILISLMTAVMGVMWMAIEEQRHINEAQGEALAVQRVEIDHLKER